jgi:hypothetical protein
MTEPRTLPEPVIRWQVNLRTINAIVAIIAIVLGWVVSSRTPNPGWMIIPAAAWFAIFIGNRLRGQLAYRITVAALTFFGFISVGAYATALLRFWLGPFEPKDLVEAVAPMTFVVLLPGVIVIAFLLLRGLVIALNSKDDRNA